MERERKESAKGAEFRHKTPGIPCPPHKSPPCREVSEREREAKARGKGSSGKKTLPSGPRRWRRNAKKDSDWKEEVYTNFDSSPMTGTSDVQLKSKAVERRGKHRRRRCNTAKRVRCTCERKTKVGHSNNKFWTSRK